MPEISKEVISLLYFLMPGFLTAWVIFGLTSHKKQEQFERLIQALIYTILITALVYVVQKICLYFSKFYSFGEWTEQTNLIASYLTAIFLGLFISIITNNDQFFIFLRRHGFTKRSSYPNEWSDVLNKYPSYVVLHLDDGLRLYGWPDFWPSDPQNGQFFISSPSWLLENGLVELHGVEGILIDVKKVVWVEILSINREEINE